MYRSDSSPNKNQKQSSGSRTLIRVYVNKSKKQTIICLIHDLVHTYYFKQTLMQVRRAQNTRRIEKYATALNFNGFVDFAREEKRKHTRFCVQIMRKQWNLVCLYRIEILEQKLHQAMWDTLPNRPYTLKGFTKPSWHSKFHLSFFLFIRLTIVIHFR